MSPSETTRPRTATSPADDVDLDAGQRGASRTTSGAGRGAPPPPVRPGRPSSGAGPVAVGEEAAAPAGSSAPAPSPSTGPASTGPRKVRLTLARINPWSAAKLSFLLSVALGIVAVVAVAVLWSVVDSMGVFTDVDGVIRDVVGSESNFRLLDYVGFSRVLSVTVFLAVVDVVLITIMATLATVLYNLSSSLVGGVRLTLSDD